MQNKLWENQEHSSMANSRDSMARLITCITCSHRATSIYNSGFCAFWVNYSLAVVTDMHDEA